MQLFLHELGLCELCANHRVGESALELFRYPASGGIPLANDGLNSGLLGLLSLFGVHHRFAVKVCHGGKGLARGFGVDTFKRLGKLFRRQSFSASRRYRRFPGLALLTLNRQFFAVVAVVRVPSASV